MFDQYCEHHVKKGIPCPWCLKKFDDKKIKIELFDQPKKSFQLYQSIFTDFINQIAHRSLGPMSVSIVATDISGEVFNVYEGRKDDIDIHIVALKERKKLL